MKVNAGFAFTDEQLRTIRAALGRGGTATRKECRYFIERAVEAALKAAPEPKPKRRVAPKPVIVPNVPLTEDEETTAWRTKREAIKKMYKVNPRTPR